MKILVTGGAGFIGSHLVDALLANEQITGVRVLDNLSTGLKENLAHLHNHPRFEWMEGDIRDYATCEKAVAGIDRISHQAALGSVPRSINDPITTNAVNITGMLHILEAARKAGVSRVIYAASSSTYGDHPGLPKVEDHIGKPLSPYAVTKYVNELYAQVFTRVYGLETIGLRYFNVFGPRQRPDGPYAAVMPKFMTAVKEGKSPQINGDGLTSRDFTYVANAVQANLLALLTDNAEALNRVYNVACGEQTSLLQLVDYLAAISGKSITPTFGPQRAGDVRHSLADISLAQQYLGYQPQIKVSKGLELTFATY